MIFHIILLQYQWIMNRFGIQMPENPLTAFAIFGISGQILPGE